MKTTKACCVCEKNIDKSDAQEAWVTVVRSSFFLGDKYTPENRRIMHLSCTPASVLVVGDFKIVTGGD